MIRFDEQMREITLSVRDLIYFDAAPALRPEPSPGLRARAGAREHRRHQQEAEVVPGYRSEFPVEHRLERRGYGVVIQGRIDGLFEKDGRWVVEELKTVLVDPSSFAPGALARAVLEEGAYADYRMQLELYVLFMTRKLSQREGEAGAPGPVVGRLVLRNIASGEPAESPGEAATEDTAVVEFEPDLVQLQEWVERRLDLIIDELEREAAARESGRAAAECIRFPFPLPRPGQGELIDLLGEVLEKGEHLLVSAPTGVGKTAAILTAALRFGLSRGMKVFYATAKTTQQRVVAETLERIAEASGTAGGAPPFRAVVLRARDKICPNLAEAGFIYCHEEVCRYARDYAIKVANCGAVESLLASPVALPESALAAGLAAQACPFELSLDAALLADLVVGDYNHVFNPQSYLRRFFQDRRARRAILIVDEAHNLYARGRESFSPGIARREVAALREWARGEGDPASTNAPPTVTGAATVAWCRRLEAILAELSAYGRDELGDPPVYPVELDPSLIGELSAELEEIRTRGLLGEGRRSSRAPAALTPGRENPLEAFASRWSRFTSALESLEGAPFQVLYDKSGEGAGGHVLRILCLDPAVPLGRRMASFHSVIAVSATLEPLDFYRDVLGFPPARTRTAAFPSPFPPENRKVVVWDRVSTYFRSRSRDVGEIARLIEEIAAVERGNYLACFSSYRYLREVLAHVSPGFRSSCLVQTPGMAEEERDRLLALLREPDSARTVLAVQGGIFTEGVDYPDRMLIGAIVVGPGLPAVTFDEERVRDHFEDRYQDGFRYAYLFPGMNRVIQSAGRVIRSESDLGVIVLLGERFGQSQYSRLFPTDWYRASPRELIAKDLLQELRNFWEVKRDDRGAPRAIEPPALS